MHNLEDKLRELISNSLLTSQGYHNGEPELWSEFFLIEADVRLDKLCAQRTIYNYKIQIEDDNTIYLHYQRSRAGMINTIEFKGIKREMKIDQLLNDRS